MQKENSTIWLVNLNKFEKFLSEPSEEPCPEMRIILKIMEKVNKERRQVTYENIVLRTETLFPPETTEEIKNLFSIKYFKMVNESLKKDKFGIEAQIKSRKTIVFFHRTNCIFVHTTGIVPKELQKYCESEFPIKIASRLVDPESINANERIMFVGNIKRKILYMRDKESIDTRDISGLLTSLTAELKTNASIYKFGFLRGLPTSNTNTNEIVTTKPIPLKLLIKCKSIKLYKPLSVDQDVQLLDQYSLIFNGENTYTYEPAGITDVKEMSEDFRKGVRMVDTEEKMLNDELCQQLYGLTKDPKYPFNFEIARDDKNFATASMYKMIFNRKIIQTFNSRPSASDILSCLKGFFSYHGENFTKKIKDKMRRIKLSYYYEERKYNSGKLIDFIECLLVHDKNNFWRLNQQWLEVSNDCIVDIHIRFLNLLNENNFLIPIGHSDHLNEKWILNKKKNERENAEDIFNTQFNDEKYPNFIVGDKVIVRSIELFDILKIANTERTDNTCIYHAKIGFDHKTRDVCSQLRNSATLVASSIVQKSKGITALERYYHLLTQKRSIAAKKLLGLNINNANDFLKIFEVKNLAFIYAILLDRTKGVSLRNEKEVKYKITKDDIKEYLRGELDKQDDVLLIKTIIEKGKDLTDEIYEYLTNSAKYFTHDTGIMTSKLLYRSNSKPKPNARPNAHTPEIDYEKISDGLLVPYMSKFRSLIAKIDLVETKKTLQEKGFTFKIDEIEHIVSESSQIQSSEDCPNTPSTPKPSTSTNNRNSSSTKKTGSRKKTFPDSPNQKKLTAYNFTKNIKNIHVVKQLLQENVNETPAKRPRHSEPSSELAHSSSAGLKEIGQNSSKEVEENTNSENSSVETEVIDETKIEQ